MQGTCERALVKVFQEAARRVPAYAQILAEECVSPDSVHDRESFLERVPVIDKRRTFGRFPVARLCMDGDLVTPASVLTSSGHSGRFAFGLYERRGAEAETSQLDAVLDLLFGVAEKSTLLINCLPMGVKVPSRLCTVAETSVRADMVTALVKGFAETYDQFLLIGETGFIKHVLELGEEQGIDWHAVRVHVVVGEEPLAENARRYLHRLLGTDVARPGDGMILSSMGIAEVGLNLFSEFPQLAMLRSALHDHRELLADLPGPTCGAVPMIFTFDPKRILVEILPGDRLILTTLEAGRRLPLIRYETGDKASHLRSDELDALLQKVGLPREAFADLPVVLMHGRGEHVLAGDVPVFPEEVKEGLYAAAELTRLTTCNFRLRSGEKEADVRIQLAPGVPAEDSMDERFADGLRRYCSATLRVRCERYEEFGSGMSLDYERKFRYVDG